MKQRKNHSMAYKVTGMLSILLIVLVILMVFANSDKGWFVPVVVAIMGLSGGLIGAIQKYRDTTEEQQSRILKGSFCYHYAIPSLMGGNFALVLMLIFASSFNLMNLNDALALFPECSLHGLETSYEICHPKTYADLAKLWVWSFIAGYSSRLVPTILRGIERKISRVQTTPESKTK